MAAIDTTVYPRTHTGIGLSNHKTGYSSGVKIGNWVEDTSNYAVGGRSILKMEGRAGGAGGHPYETTHRYTFTDRGKTGADLTLNKTDATSNKYSSRGQPLERIFHHKLNEDSPTEFFGSTNDLAFGAQRRVQDILWSDSKFHNRGVPCSAPHATTKALALSQRGNVDADPFQTTSKAFFGTTAALSATLQATARAPVPRPRDPEGEAASVGRKVRGEFGASLDLGFLKTGLRRNPVPRR